MEVYLDNSATTKPRKEVIEIINKSFTDFYGNPSSLHSKGVEAERMVKDSRRKVAKALGVNENEIFFTSGGTESNNIAIFGSIEGNKRRGNHIITSKVEHPSVLNVFKELEERGFDVTYLDVDNYGHINIEEFKRSLRGETILVSIMYVNNETGAIQPIRDIGRILNKLDSKPLFHVDAIQAFGKLPLNLNKLPIDLLTVSAHKFHGPKGIGALFIRRGTKIKPIIYGGNQELGIRSGTENIHGILGLGVAAELTQLELEESIKKMQSLKIRLYNGVKENIKDIRFNSEIDNRFAPHILNISFLGIRGEVLLHALEQKGIFVSTGSACSSKKKSFSHVLKAMGLSEDEMEGAIRFSFNPLLTEEDIDYTINELIVNVSELRQVMGRR